MRVVTWPDKYTGESFVNGINWTPRGIGDAEGIVSENFLVRRGAITISDMNHVDPVSFATFSGGEVGITEVLCRIVTTEGRELEEVAQFKILESLPS